MKVVKSRGFESLVETDKVNRFKSTDLLGEKSHILLTVCVFSSLIMLGLIKISFMREKEN